MILPSHTVAPRPDASMSRLITACEPSRSGGRRLDKSSEGRATDPVALLKEESADPKILDTLAMQRLYRHG